MPRRIAEPFTIGSSPNIVSYNFTDITKGYAYEKLYFLTLQDQTTVSYHLLNQVIYSHTTSTVSAQFDGTLAKSLDLDFDIPIEKLMIIPEGTAILQMGLQLSVVAGSTTASGYIIAKLRHVRGGTETELGSGQSQTVSAVGAATTTTAELTNVPIPITVRQDFKKDDTLRVTIEGWTSHTGGGGDKGTIRIAHSPQNQSAGTGETWEDALTSVSFILVPLMVTE